jgi:hypothetical protein
MAEVAEQQAVDEKFSDEPEVAAIEREAIEEIAAVAQRHANRLPIRSERRPLMIKLANLRLAIDDPEAGNREEPGKDRAEETKALKGLHEVLLLVLPEIDEDSLWRVPIARMAQGIASTLESRATERGQLSEAASRRVAGWVSLRMSDRLELESDPERAIEGAEDIQRLAEIVRALLEGGVLDDEWGKVVVEIAREELTCLEGESKDPLDANPEAIAIARSAIAIWGEAA